MSRTRVPKYVQTLLGDIGSTAWRGRHDGDVYLRVDKYWGSWIEVFIAAKGKGHIWNTVTGEIQYFPTPKALWAEAHRRITAEKQKRERLKGENNE